MWMKRFIKDVDDVEIIATSPKTDQWKWMRRTRLIGGSRDGSKKWMRRSGNEMDRNRNFHWISPKDWQVNGIGRNEKGIQIGEDETKYQANIYKKRWVKYIHHWRKDVSYMKRHRTSLRHPPKDEWVTGLNNIKKGEKKKETESGCRVMEKGLGELWIRRMADILRRRMRGGKEVQWRLRNVLVRFAFVNKWKKEGKKRNTTLVRKSEPMGLDFFSLI